MPTTLDATDLESFLAAICAAPDDELPRLVLADWLDDRGHPGADEVRTAKRFVDVLNVVYPAHELALKECPTLDTRGFGPRAVSFKSTVRLCPDQRPFLRVVSDRGGGVVWHSDFIVHVVTGAPIEFAVRNERGELLAHANTLLAGNCGFHGFEPWPVDHLEIWAGAQKCDKSELSVHLTADYAAPEAV